MTRFFHCYNSLMLYDFKIRHSCADMLAYMVYEETFKKCTGLKILNYVHVQKIELYLLFLLYRNEFLRVLIS